MRKLSAQRAVWASRIAASTIAPPMSCAAPNDSPSQRNATALAATGSSIATIPTRVAEMCRSAAATRRKVIIVPATTT